MTFVIEYEMTKFLFYVDKLTISNLISCNSKYKVIKVDLVNLQNILHQFFYWRMFIMHI